MPEREHGSVPAAEAESAARDATMAVPRTPAALALQLQQTAGNAATARVLGRLVNPRRRSTATGQDDSSYAYQRHTGWAFVRGAGEDATGVNADDVTQGALGDCYFLSPVMAVARINPHRIRNLIQNGGQPIQIQPDGTRIFHITLYERHAIGSPSRRTFRVDDRFITEGSGNPRYAQHGDLGVHGPEIWVMLLEKAWAAMCGSYDEAHFGLMRDGMTAVTGHDTDTTFIADEDDGDIFEEISSCVRAGKPVAIQTKQSFTADELFEMGDIERTVIAKHAYNVAGVDPSWRTIDIINPHGENHLREFPLVRLRRFFDYYVMSEESVR